MFSRTACAAAVMAVFALGSSAVVAQGAQPAPSRQPVLEPTSTLGAPPSAGQQGQPSGQPAYQEGIARRQAPIVAATPKEAQRSRGNPRKGKGPTMVTASNMPTSIDMLTTDVAVLPVYRAHRNLYQTTPFATLGSVQTFSEGTPGSASGLSIRGQAMEDTLVLVDGFRVSSAGGTDFSLLPSSWGNRTEVLRGPGSAVYGQNAGGGVVQFLSDPAGRKMNVSGEAGIGGRGYMQMRGRMSAGNEVITARVDAGRERGDGFDVSAADAPFAENDQDPWKRENVAGRLDARLSTATRVTFLAMRNTVNADFDGANALESKKRLELSGVKASHELAPGTTLDAKIGQTSVSRTFNHRVGAEFDKTKLREYALGAVHEFAPNLKARVGLERLEESYDTEGLNAPTRATNAMNAVGEGRFGRHLVNAGLRFDDSNRYKQTFSHHLGYGYQLAPNLRLVANVGVGYRAPELGDYYASPENNRLKQQRNQTVDAGAWWQMDRKTSARAIVYRTRMRDRITASGDLTRPGAFSMSNVGRAEVRGVALSAAHDTNPGEFNGLRVQANLDLLDPKNKSTGRELPNVAKRMISASVDYGMDEEFGFGADLQLNNRHFSDEANSQRVGGQTLVNLRSSWRVSNEITLHGEVYNLGNRSYSTVRYYNQQPRTFMFGVSYRMP